MRRWRLWAAFLRCLQPASAQEGPQGWKGRPFWWRRVKCLLIHLPVCLENLPIGRSDASSLDFSSFAFSVGLNPCMAMHICIIRHVARHDHCINSSFSSRLRFYYFIFSSYLSILVSACLSENWYPDVALLRLISTCLMHAHNIPKAQTGTVLFL